VLNLASGVKTEKYGMKLRGKDKGQYIDKFAVGEEVWAEVNI
jgi:hypothetical protein